jgi:hypothetical protein
MKKGTHKATKMRADLIPMGKMPNPAKPEMKIEN